MVDYMCESINELYDDVKDWCEIQLNSRRVFNSDLLNVDETCEFIANRVFDGLSESFDSLNERDVDENTTPQLVARVMRYIDDDLSDDDMSYLLNENPYDLAYVWRYHELQDTLNSNDYSEFNDILEMALDSAVDELRDTLFD